MTLSEHKKTLLKLLALDGPKDSSYDAITGSPRVMKEIFLTQKETDLDLFEFHSYKLGPVCFEIHDHLDELEEQGFVQINENKESVQVFSLTPKGKDLSRELESSELNDEVLDTMEEKKRKINSMSFREMISHVYEKYPDMTKESEVKWMA